jgi:cell division protein FtsB
VENPPKEDYKEITGSVSPAILMTARARTIICTSALVAAGALAAFRLAGPSGIPMVLERRRQVRELQEQNADLRRSIEVRKERIRSLSGNPSDLDLEIRRGLRLQKKKETTFVLPEQKQQ